ncbi:hypothetical protein MKW94_006551, partial [Papaver nudicaule]|nr:hypothetical protein [Papaver nudicaule]
FLSSYIIERPQCYVPSSPERPSRQQQKDVKESEYLYDDKMVNHNVMACMERYYLGFTLAKNVQIPLSKHYNAFKNIHQVHNRKTGTRCSIHQVHNRKTRTRCIIHQVHNRNFGRLLTL